MKTAIGDFLSRLVELGQANQSGDQQQDLKFDHRFKIADIDVKSDICLSCHSSVEEACIQFNNLRWHTRCFVCSRCRSDLNLAVETAMYDDVDKQTFCASCAPPSARRGFRKATQLQQYTFLLRVALKRLISLLKVKGMLFVIRILPCIDDATPCR